MSAAAYRCVGCQQKQGAPHKPGCVFSFLTIGG